MRIALVCSLIGMLCGETFEIEPGWYRWADQSNSLARYAPSEMRGTDMSNRCLCEKGFVATKTAENAFMIVSAPRGYSDTVGKEFIARKVYCLNCAD